MRAVSRSRGFTGGSGRAPAASITWRGFEAASFLQMPNIHQQERRVRSAARERGENLRWRSTAKTLYKRLESAVEGGDADATKDAHGDLVRWLDKASARGVLHPNRAARKKSQAARLVAGPKS